MVSNANMFIYLSFPVSVCTDFPGCVRLSGAGVAVTGLPPPDSRRARRQAGYPQLPEAPTTLTPRWGTQPRKAVAASAEAWTAVPRRSFRPKRTSRARRGPRFGVEPTHRHTTMGFSAARQVCQDHAGAPHRRCCDQRASALILRFLRGCCRLVQTKGLGIVVLRRFMAACRSATEPRRAAGGGVSAHLHGVEPGAGREVTQRGCRVSQRMTSGPDVVEHDVDELAGRNLALDGAQEASWCRGAACSGRTPCRRAH